jgi:hypothetical protein
MDVGVHRPTKPDAVPVFARAVSSCGTRVASAGGGRLDRTRVGQVHSLGELYFTKASVSQSR